MHLSKVVSRPVWCELELIRAFLLIEAFSAVQDSLTLSASRQWTNGKRPKVSKVCHPSFVCDEHE